TRVFFVSPAYHKLTQPNRRAHFAATLQGSDIPFIMCMQWFVPIVEFLPGLSVSFGFLPHLAALGRPTICLVAACTDGMPRVRASGAIDRVDVIDDVLYLPEVLYMVLLALFVANGAGPFSLDAILSRYL